MKLYLMHIVKGKQEFNIGDNIKDILEDDWLFNDERIPLDGNYDFLDFLHNGIDVLYKMRNGYEDFWGKHKPKSRKEIINHSLVICSGNGTIRGIMRLNYNGDKELISAK